MTKKKKILLIMLISIIVISLIGGTFALYRIGLFSDLSVNTITKGLDYYINYDKGQDIAADNLTGSNNYSGGVSSEVTLYKKDNTYNIYGNIYLNISSIGNNLKSSNGLKYTVLNDNVIIDEGIINNTGKKLLAQNLELTTEIKTYSVYIWLDSNSQLTPSIEGETLTANIECEATMKKLSSADYIKYIYNSNSKTEIISNNINYNVAPSVSLMNDRLGGTTSNLDGGNLRYYGTNPDNYIYFNCSDYNNQSDTTCEKWRIIGTFDGRVKLIRGQSIGAYSWDNKDILTNAETNNGKNDWTTARIMKLLNPSDYYTIDPNDNSYGQSLYYNSGSGTCFSGQNNAIQSCNFTTTGIKNATTRNLISEEVWNLGGSSNIGYSNYMYTIERGTEVYSGRTTTWTGKISLAYPSDYGYAVDLNNCNQTLNNYNNSTCLSNNWLFNLLTNNGTQYAWLLTSNSSLAYSVFGTQGAGYVGEYETYLAQAVLPVLYLNAEQTIKGGSGKSTNPYRLQVS